MLLKKPKPNHIYLSNYASDLLQSNKNKVNCCPWKVNELYWKLESKNAENFIWINKYIKKRSKIKLSVLVKPDANFEESQLADKSDIRGKFCISKVVVFVFLFSNSDYIFLKNDSLETPLTTPSLFVTHIDVSALILLSCGKSLCKSITHQWRAVISHEFSNLVILVILTMRHDSHLTIVFYSCHMLDCL